MSILDLDLDLDLGLVLGPGLGLGIGIGLAVYLPPSPLINGLPHRFLRFLVCLAGTGRPA